MEWIKVIKDLSNTDEISVEHLIGLTFQGEWDQREKGYLVQHEGTEYLVRQDEVESASCAFCDDLPMPNSNVCIECLNEGLEEAI